MKPIERLIVGIDISPWSFVYRVAIGVVLPLVFRVLTGGNDSVWVPSVLFFGFLVALRVGPAVLRRLLPFSAEAKQIWAARRALSKEYDSHAWQKLFWIGLGLLLHAGVAGGLQTGEFVVMLFCLIGGGAGVLRWHQVRAARSASEQYGLAASV